jgi:hypothetical protein
VDSQNSNFDPSVISSPASTFSQSEFFSGELDDMVPEDIKHFINSRRSFNSVYHLSTSELENQMEKTHAMHSPRTMPNDGYLQASMGADGGAGMPASPALSQSARPSTSCPSDMARIKKLQSMNLTEVEIRHVLKDMKDRHKKEAHNMIERRRRFNINDRIKELGVMLSRENQLTDKQNKGLILKASIDYIRNLESKLNKTRDLENKLNQMTVMNKKLMEQINGLHISSPHAIQQHNNASLLNLVNSGSVSHAQMLEETIKAPPFFCGNQNSSGGSHQLTGSFNSLIGNDFYQQNQQPAHSLSKQGEAELNVDEAKVLEDILNFYEENSLVTGEDRANIDMLANVPNPLAGNANQMNFFN